MRAVVEHEGIVVAYGFIDEGDLRRLATQDVTISGLRTSDPGLDGAGPPPLTDVLVGRDDCLVKVLTDEGSTLEQHIGYFPAVQAYSAVFRTSTAERR